MEIKVQLELSEAEYRELVLCYSLGDLVKDSTETKSQPAIIAQIEMLQKLSKAAYEAKLKGAELEEGIYSYSQEIEEEMLDIFEDFKEYIESGESAAEDEMILKQIAEMEKQDKKKK